MMSRHRLTIRPLAIALATLVVGTVQAQTNYPTKPIRMILPYAPGGTTDLLARLLGPKMTESWGQAVVVDNRPGGNTLVGTQALTRALPDGHTLLMMAIAHTIIPNLIPTPYDPIKDFTPVATVGKGELLLVVHPSVPANNLRELIALAKARPGQLNYASASTGGPLHLAGELFDMLAGVKTTHVPYKGGGPAMLDLVAGHVQMMYSPPPQALPHVKTGKLRPIAISGPSRSPAAPNVPTFAEAGMDGFTVKNWFGLLAPAGTPRPIVDKIATEVARILRLPEIHERLVSQGTDPFISTPDEFGELLRSDLALYGKIIKTANIRIDK